MFPSRLLASAAGALEGGEGEPIEREPAEEAGSSIGEPESGNQVFCIPRGVNRNSLRLGRSLRHAGNTVKLKQTH